MQAVCYLSHMVKFLFSNLENQALSNIASRKKKKERKPFQHLPLKTVYKAGKTPCRCPSSCSPVLKSLGIYDGRRFIDISQSVVPGPICLKRRCLRPISDIGFFQSICVINSAVWGPLPCTIHPSPCGQFPTAPLLVNGEREQLYLLMYSPDLFVKHVRVFI